MISTTAFAAGDLTLPSENLTFSSQNFIEGRAVKIYATVNNVGNVDALGVVRFYANGNQIGSDQVVSVVSGNTDTVFISWVPSFGGFQIGARVYPWEDQTDDPNNNASVAEVFSARDTDHDGIPNNQDEDDDNDGVNDEDDVAPLDPNEHTDTDGDGAGDNADEDDDNDGVPDEHDDLPKNPNETIDTDKDGEGNIADEDDDNDGIDDDDEEKNGTDPLKPDSDNDGVNDNEDDFPIDNSESEDTDKDGIGNNADIDDDNDGSPDKDDDFPFNKGPVIKVNNSSQDKITVGVLEEFTFDASDSYDEDGQIVSYVWSLGGKVIHEGNALNFFFPEEGEQDLELTVTDSDGEIRSKVFAISVVNIGLYKQILIAFITILLASVIYFKYIAGAKKSKKDNQ